MVEPWLYEGKTVYKIPSGQIRAIRKKKKERAISEKRKPSLGCLAGIKIEESVKRTKRKKPYGGGPLSRGGGLSLTKR